MELVSAEALQVVSVTSQPDGSPCDNDVNSGRLDNGTSCDSVVIMQRRLGITASPTFQPGYHGYRYITEGKCRPGGK